MALQNPNDETVLSYLNSLLGVEGPTQIELSLWMNNVEETFLELLTLAEGEHQWVLDLYVPSTDFSDNQYHSYSITIPGSSTSSQVS